MTQKEIALILGVSRTTVARALKGDNKIKIETKEKILKLCQEVGYKKNYIGSILANQRERKIYAFLVRSKNKIYLEEISQGLSELKDEISKYNVKLEIIVTDIDKPKEQIIKVKTVLEYNQVEGIIIVPLLANELEDIFKTYKTIPVACLDKKVNNEFSFIGSDYNTSGRIVGGILAKVAKSCDKVVILDSEDDKISSSIYVKGLLTQLKESHLRDVSRLKIEKLDNNLDEILKIPNLKDTKYLYTSRYVDKVAYFLKDQGLSNIKLVANGVDINTLDLIRAEQVIVATKENYFLQAYLAGKVIFNYLNGKESRMEYTTKPEIIFKENVDQVELNYERELFKNFNIL